MKVLFKLLWILLIAGILEACNASGRFTHWSVLQPTKANWKRYWNIIKMSLKNIKPLVS